MQIWRCEGCDYIYDPKIGDQEHGVNPGVEWIDLPSDWVCPVCGLGTECFTEM